MATLTNTVDAIRAEARQVDVTKALLTLLVLPFFIVGWLARWTWRGTVLVLSFATAAVKVGWAAAAPMPKGGG